VHHQRLDGDFGAHLLLDGGHAAAIAALQLQQLVAGRQADLRALQDKGILPVPGHLASPIAAHFHSTWREVQVDVSRSVGIAAVRDGEGTGNRAALVGVGELDALAAFIVLQHPQLSFDA
jgi:hypothetical protein